MSWINLDVDLGAQMIVYTIGLRALAAKRIHAELREVISRNPEQVGAWAVGVVESYRPELRGGVSFFGVECSISRQQWRFMVAHPSLPASPCNQLYPEERLELCPRCRKPLSVWTALVVESVIGDFHQTVEICQECYEAGKCRGVDGRAEAAAAGILRTIREWPDVADGSAR